VGKGPRPSSPSSAAEREAVDSAPETGLADQDGLFQAAAETRLADQGGLFQAVTKIGIIDRKIWR